MAMGESVARVTTSQAFPIESPSIDTRVRTAPAPVRKFNMASMWFCIGVAVAAFWFIASFGAKIDATNYQIDNLQTQIKAQTAENASLTASVARLKEPSRILSIALGAGEKYANPVTITATSKH
ncbi:hypothetical protein [Alicyclobacillus ferrooxydans]|uniref:Cell division protein FtsL n=1 Tax=Alicyclobacillus ferrooxydans TaxID=471514 RepID=A0A0P9CHV8_9BACL|nr:hypothetical protein [Alicyclobacillus ferrooxydans]KPV45313.1 hypothetical protein AN477_02845 [Alicyclobacillus ferrooxydans]